MFVVGVTITGLTSGFLPVPTLAYHETITPTITITALVRIASDPTIRAIINKQGGGTEVFWQ